MLDARDGLVAPRANMSYRNQFYRMELFKQSRMFSLSSQTDVVQMQQWVQKEGKSAALFGANASGKTLLFDGLLDRAVDKSIMGMVSFESTLWFIKQHGDKTVGWICGGINSAQARSLVVRFGLVNSWPRRVDTLSTGELRKLMLAKAMAQESKLLLLDGAHDGLDPRSRYQLTMLLSKIAKGFPKLLVSLGGTGKEKKIQAQLLQVVQRAEELPKEVDTGFFLSNHGIERREFGTTSINFDSKRIEKIDQMIADASDFSWTTEDWMESLNQLWSPPEKLQSPIVQFKGVMISYEEEHMQNKGKKTGKGLQDVSWTVKDRGEMWAIIGGNGAGKSTIARLIASPVNLENEQTLTELAVSGSREYDNSMDPVFSQITESSVVLFGHQRGTNHAERAITERIGIVSIDAHIRTAFIVRNLEMSTGREVSTFDIIRSGLYGSACSGSASTQALERMLQDSKTNDAGQTEKVHAAIKLAGLSSENLGKAFDRLSMAEQRLVLLARALVHGPDLLICDEAAHGLDPSHRRRLLDLLCFLRKQGLSIVVITHHADEIPETTSHLLELDTGKVVSCGRRESSIIKEKLGVRIH